MYKTKISLFFLIVLTFFKETKTCNDCSKPYEPPGNIKFPYGDENQFNTDVAENDTNTLLCSDATEFRPQQGRCPFPPEDPGDMRLTNPYVQCPDFPELIPPGNIALGDPVPPSSVQCKSCDLKLTQDGTAVLLKCTGCYDLPDPDRSANCTEKDLLYKVFFIEIANYTSVEVKGKEHF